MRLRPGDLAVDHRYVVEQLKDPLGLVSLVRLEAVGLTAQKDNDPTTYAYVTVTAHFPFLQLLIV